MLYSAAMENLDRLAKKVEEAANEIISLKKDRKQLTTEVELLRREVQSRQALVRENEKFKRDRELLKTRLTRLQKKIEKQILVEATVQAALGGTHREESAN